MAAVLLILLSVLAPLTVALLVVVMLLSRRVRDLARAARCDPLTGLLNRRGLALAWDGLPGNKALLFVDLVGFKAVNDRLGHATGDALLAGVARRLDAAVAPPGVLARWGGDEFVALVPAARATVQVTLFENAAVMKHRLATPGGMAEVAIGVSVVAASGFEALGDALAAASADLLALRTAGSNAVQRPCPQMVS